MEASVPRNILERIDRARVSLVTAALTLLKRTLNTGFKPIGGMGGFDAWNATVRGAVCYAGSLGFPVGDPVESIDASLSDDPETGKLRMLLAAWDNVFLDSPTTVALCIAKANELVIGNISKRYPGLSDVCNEIAGERNVINTRRLSRWIERQKDRVIDGKFFHLSEIKTYGSKHWVVKCKN